MEWPNHLAYVRCQRAVNHYSPQGPQRWSDKAENILGPGHQLQFPIDRRLAKTGKYVAASRTYSATYSCDLADVDVLPHIRPNPCVNKRNLQLPTRHGVLLLQTDL